MVFLIEVSMSHRTDIIRDYCKDVDSYVQSCFGCHSLFLTNGSKLFQKRKTDAFGCCFYLIYILSR